MEYKVSKDKTRSRKIFKQHLDMFLYAPMLSKHLMYNHWFCIKNMYKAAACKSPCAFNLYET